MAKEKVTISRTPESPGDLAGAKEAAQILGVERTRVARYQRKGKMPKRVAQLGSGPVYLRKEVEEMAKRRRENGAAKGA